jgi:hypothetical protein
VLADGWLVVGAYFLIFSWSRWFSFGGFALFYKKHKVDGRIEIKGKTWLQDFLHLGWAATAIILYLYLDAVMSPMFLAVTLSIASFRIIDLLFDFLMLAVFGNRYGRPWTAAMTARRLHRTLLVDILMLLELVFWNACWVFIVAKICPALYDKPITTPAHALHMSVATVTTIGYGTYAPVETLSVLAAFLQAISALLLLSGVIAGLFSQIASKPPGDSHIRPQSSLYNDSYGLPVIWNTGIGWKLRWVLPVAFPIAVVFFGVLWLLGTGWLENAA